MACYQRQQLAGRPSAPVVARIVRQFFTPWLDRPADALTKAELIAWHSGLSRTPTHANKALTVLRAAYNYASYCGLYAGHNPTAGIRKHRRPPRARRMRHDEWQRLSAVLAHLALKHRAYFLCLILTGKRRSEPLGMRWDAVDWHRAVWLNPLTKNGQPEEVPLPQQVLELLAQLPRRGPYVFAGRAPDRPWHPASASKAWGQIRKKAGIASGVFGLHLRDLRRSVSSDLSDANVNLQTVKTVLHHASLSQTDRYIVQSVEPARTALQARADLLLAST